MHLQYTIILMISPTVSAFTQDSKTIRLLFLTFDSIYKCLLKITMNVGRIEFEISKDREFLENLPIRNLRFSCHQAIKHWNPSTSISIQNLNKAKRLLPLQPLADRTHRGKH
jgi:hypothetical protein